MAKNGNEQDRIKIILKKKPPIRPEEKIYLTGYLGYLENQYRILGDRRYKKFKEGTTIGIGVEESKEELPVLGETKEPEEPEEPEEYQNITFPLKGIDVSVIDNALKSTTPTPIKRYIQILETLGFSGALLSLQTKKDIQNVINQYKLPRTKGAGRYYGGVGRPKGSLNKNPKTPPVKTPSGKKRGRPRKLALEEEAPEEEAPEEEAPEADEPLGSLPVEEAEEADVFETIEDDDVKAVAIKNADVSRKLDKALRKVANTGQKSPVPSYITKIYELMTNLVQFIGRTTLLYLTKIKKNLNYLDEEQVKIIFSTIQKFKDNLTILETFKNKGGAIIKETLYNQVEKETLGLYNEINNSIRNYNKLTDYTTFAGAGRMHSRMVGGYYINNSPNQFVMKSTTKRFL